MGLKIHADEVHDLGGAALAAELRVTSAEHLLRTNERTSGPWRRPESSGYSSGNRLQPAKRLCPGPQNGGAGLPVAIATDCNPGTGYTESMPFVFGLSVLNMRLSVSEALVASTLNGAYAVGMSERVGSLDVGKNADFLLLDGDSPAILAYHAGVSPVVRVYKQAEMVPCPDLFPGGKTGREWSTDNEKIVLGVDGMTLEELVAIAREGAESAFPRNREERIVKSRSLVERWLQEGRVIYGVTTGFGALSDVVIPADDTKLCSTISS